VFALIGLRGRVCSEFGYCSSTRRLLSMHCSARLVRKRECIHIDNWKKCLNISSLVSCCCSKHMCHLRFHKSLLFFRVLFSDLGLQTPADFGDSCSDKETASDEETGPSPSSEKNACVSDGCSIQNRLYRGFAQEGVLTFVRRDSLRRVVGSARRQVVYQSNVSKHHSRPSSRTQAKLTVPSNKPTKPP
jgi:hypothetical protein